VLSVRAGQRGQVGGLLHGHSGSGQSVLMEPYEAVEANNRISELREEEQREVARVLRELTEELRRHGESLTEAFEAVGLCDLVRAGARWRSICGRRPRNGTRKGGCASARGAIRCWPRRSRTGAQRWLPLDLEMDRERPVLLVSGPNMGGKSVVLKTVGLLTLMARAGLHVPAADGTDLPVTDGVYVDLGDEQSIEGDLSTFAGHLRNISLLWEKATRDSLVLLDELGGGTDPEDGAAMAMAVLEGMAERGALTIATTHMSALKLYAGEQPRMQNAAMEFDAVSLSPRFRLKVGEAGWSRAFDIARRIVSDPDFLTRAERFRSPLQLHLDRWLSEVDEEKRKLEAERQLSRKSRRSCARPSS